jgi:sulfur relay (sulfurtransferase) DsrF/TusC family protein
LIGKHILLMINHAPHGSIHFSEGLRAATGLIASTDELNISVVFLGEGVYAALSGLERGEAAKYVATLAEWGFGLSAESESLAEREIPVGELAADVKVISRAQVLDLIRAADFTIDF